VAAVGLRGLEVFGIFAALCYTSAGVWWSDVSGRHAVERHTGTHSRLGCADDETDEGGRAKRLLTPAVCSSAPIPGICLGGVTIYREAGRRAAVCAARRCCLEPARREARGVRPLAPTPRS
jgi:hypothetical protein